MTLNLSSKTGLTLSIGALACLLVFTWQAAMSFRDLRDEITTQRQEFREEVAALRREIAILNKDRWTDRDMERWIFRFERANRDKGIAVPEVSEVKKDRVSVFQVQ
jgi:ABC-type transport system involved in cytochrome bd biosynthesis fused ATPase/permease subunit